VSESREHEIVDVTPDDYEAPADEGFGRTAWLSLTFFAVLVVGMLGCSVLQPWNWFS